MKKIIIPLLAIAVLIGCNRLKENEYKLTVKIDGIENGTNVLVKKANEENLPVDVDSTQVMDGAFVLQNFVETPEMHYIFIEGVKGNLGYIAEPGTITVTAYKDSISKSILKGTPSNDDFNRFIVESRKISNKITAVREQFTEATKTGDTVTINTLRETYAELMTEAGEYEKDFIKDNPDSFVSLVILERLLLMNATPVEEIKNMFDPFSEELKNSVKGKKISEQLSQLTKTSVGSTAPDFEGPTPEGETLALNDVKGKVTIIDFWAAWCKPCRVENPRVVEMYNKYREKGLSIVGVSLDRSGDDWKKAIADDGLTWNHVSHLQYWQDPIARMYNIRAIPATFILDQEGKIVARDLRGPDLEAKIAEMLGE